MVSSRSLRIQMFLVGVRGEDLARELGCSTGTIYRWLSGSEIPDDRAAEMLRALGRLEERSRNAGVSNAGVAHD